MHPAISQHRQKPPARQPLIQPLSRKGASPSMERLRQATRPARLRNQNAGTAQLEDDAMRRLGSARTQ